METDIVALINNNRYYITKVISTYAIIKNLKGNGTYKNIFFKNYIALQYCKSTLYISIKAVTYTELVSDKLQHCSYLR